MSMTLGGGERLRTGRPRSVLVTTIFATLAISVGTAAGWSLAATGWSDVAAIAAASPTPQDKSSPSREATATPDAVTVSGKPLTCKVLDVTDLLVVVQTKDGKLFFARSKVQSIARAYDEEARDTYRKYAKNAKSADNWKKLARFCKKKGLLPEFRACLREVLVFEPDNPGAKKGLGQAQLDGKWLEEKEVELKIAAGYAVDNGQLVKKTVPVDPSKDSADASKKDGSKDGGSDSSTVVAAKRKPPSSIKILPRSKLSKIEARRIEEARENRTENAKKFREKLEKEYRAGRWHEVKTRHFAVYCNSTRDLARKYGAMMELIRGKLAKMFTSSKKRGGIRAPVRIHANQEDFISTDQFARWGGRGLGGYYMPSNQSITTYHGTFGFTGTTYSVLAHEGTHYFQGLVLQDFNNVPMWLIEGLAVYFGDGSEFDPEKKKITIGLIPRDRLSHLQEKMAAKRHTKVEKLVALTRYSGFSGSHYADSWGLIYFLVNHPSKKGEKLMKRYWATGLERKLSKGDFLDLADEYFGDVDKLEAEYVEYIMGLKPPPAGEIKGDYFISDDFQFEFKAPGKDWEFFEDEKDKKLLIGMLKPDTSAQVRIYYENNIENKKAEPYFEDWLKTHKHFEDIEHERITIAGLKGYKVTYTDTGKKPFGWSLTRRGGRIVVRRGGDDGDDDDDDDDDKNKGKGKKDEKKPEKEPREVVKYMLIQVDGVASIECSTAKGEMNEFRDLYDELNKNFNLILIRRW